MVGSHPLKTYRDERGLTQEALARELGVHSVTVSRWETGERQIDAALLPQISERTGIARRDLRPDLFALIGQAAE